MDGPVDISHPCFSRATLVCDNSVESCQSGRDEASVHGTGVASILFASHESGITGACPNCRGIIIPIFSEKNGLVQLASDQALAQGIRQAVQFGADVINISAGREIRSGANKDVLEALRECENRNILVTGCKFCQSS